MGSWQSHALCLCCSFPDNGKQWKPAKLGKAESPPSETGVQDKPFPHNFTWSLAPLMWEALSEGHGKNPLNPQMELSVSLLVFTFHLHPIPCEWRNWEWPLHPRLQWHHCSHPQGRLFPQSRPWDLKPPSCLGQEIATYKGISLRE